MLFSLAAAKPIVIVALDWCEVRNKSYDLWRSELAAAAGTTRARVLLSCVHQHDAPYTDIEAQQLLDDVRSPHKLCDPAFERDCIAKVASAIRRASFQTVTHLGTGQTPVEKVASNRRYVRADGKVSFGRTSATRDPTIRNQPEGLIDPDLKTISFWNGAKPVAALYGYSTHPMSYYGNGDVSADFPGIARRKLQAESPDVFHIYCSGASGDTMAGRYNDGSTANRQILAGRLYQAMTAAGSATQSRTAEPDRLPQAKLTFQPRKDPKYSEEELNRLLASDATPRRERLDAALGISWLRRLARRESSMYRPSTSDPLHLSFFQQRLSCSISSGHRRLLRRKRSSPLVMASARPATSLRTTPSPKATTTITVGSTLRRAKPHLERQSKRRSLNHSGDGADLLGCRSAMRRQWQQFWIRSNPTRARYYAGLHR